KDATDLALICGGRIPDQIPKAHAERPQAFVADGVTHIRYGQLVASEQSLSTIDSQLGDELVGRFAERAYEQPMVMERRQERLARRICQAHRPIRMGREKIARSAQTAE